MFEILSGLGTTFFWGAGNVVAKKTITDGGRAKAIVYGYVFEIILLLIGAILLKESFVFPIALLPAYIVQIIIGAIAVIALYRALEDGRVGVLVSISNIYVLIVIILGIVIFGEHLTTTEMIGAVLILVSAISLGIENWKSFKLEKGALFLFVTVLGWGYYFTFLKLFVPALGPYMTSVYCESGIGLVIIAHYLLKRTDLSLPKSSEGKFMALRGATLYFGSVLYSTSVGQIGVALTSAIVSTNPIISTILSYVFLKEKLSMQKYAAIVVMVIGLIIIFLF